MKIKFIKDTAYHKAGTEKEVTDGVGRLFIKMGKAEEVIEEQKKATKTRTSKRKGGE